MSDLLKQNEKITSKEQLEIILFLIKELHRTTSKDVVRKLLIRSIITSTRCQIIDENSIITCESVIKEFLNSSNVLIGQKLFILNVYLENLEQFGTIILDISLLNDKQ